MGGDDFSKGGDKKSGRPRNGGLGTVELSWLASALRQPGYKLPGVDINGDAIASEVVVRCLEQGLIEPWLPPRAGALPRVCRLTEKGEVIAENYLLCGEPESDRGALSGTLRCAEEAQEWEGQGHDPALGDLLEDEGQAWWDALPGSAPPAEEPEVPPALPPLPRSSSKPRQTAAPTDRQRTANAATRAEPQDPGLAALRSLRNGARGPRRSAKSALFAGVQLSGGLVLLAAGFALGWSIDPPFPRHEGLRISILQDTAPRAPTGDAAAGEQAPPRLEDILEIAPAAGPAKQGAPAFLTAPTAPSAVPRQPSTEHSPAGPSPAGPSPAGPSPAAPSPAERLPALKDPDLMERWDRVDAAPTPADRKWLAARTGREIETGEAFGSPPVVERILLPETPLSHNDPGYAEAPPRFGVELAALSNAAEASALRRQLIEGHAASLAGRELVVDMAETGARPHLIRSSALASREEAEALCAALIEREQTCWVIELPGGR